MTRSAYVNVNTPFTYIGNTRIEELHGNLQRNEHGGYKQHPVPTILGSLSGGAAGAQLSGLLRLQTEPGLGIQVTHTWGSLACRNVYLDIDGRCHHIHTMQGRQK